MATSRSLGTLTLDLIAKISGFVDGMTSAERAAARSQKKIADDAKQRAKETESAWKNATSSVSNLIGGALVGVSAGAVFQKFLTETVQAQKEQAGLAAALKATGNAAGFSLGRLNEMAGAMEAATGIAAGELNQAQKVLTGFTNIVGDEYAKALQAAADYSAYTGQSMVASAELMGRALNIPSVGMASLSKQGFKFTEEQIKLAKSLEETGRIAEAQKIVFDELEMTYGGAAAASRDTLGGAMSALKNTINSLMTGEGGSVDGLKRAINDMTGTLASEQTRSAFQALITWMAEAASMAIKLAANLLAFANTKDKIGAITGTDEFGKMTSGAKAAQKEVEQLTAEIARMIEVQRERPGDDRLAKRIDAWRQKLLDAQTRAQGATGALKEFADGFKPPEVAAITAPDLSPAAVGPIKLKDGTGGKGGKSQSQRDADAAEKYLQTLREQADGRKKLTAWERLSYDLASGKVKLDERQLALAQGQAAAIDMAAEAEKLRGDEVARNTALYDAQERLSGRAAEYAAQIEAYGKGDKQNAVMRERVSLLQSQQTELRKMAQDQATALATAKDADDVEQLKARYDERLSIVKNAQDKELAMFDDFQSVKKEMDGNWMLGAQASIQTYLEKTQDSYAAARDATTSMMQTIEGAFVNLFTLGESSFKSFVATILKGIAQIAAQQAASGIAGFLGTALTSLIGGGAGASSAYGLTGGGSGGLGLKFSGFRATGGPVAGGSLYRVNELGPELLSYGGSDYLMMGGSGGYVKPVGAADTERRGAGNITVVNQTTGRVDNVEQRQLTHDDIVLIIQEQTPKVMVSQTQNANSPFSRTMTGSFNMSRRR
ncbi:MAG: phage tail tape measure C-terminal domain-containing protein [Pseudomonas sp.]